MNRLMTSIFPRAAGRFAKDETGAAVVLAASTLVVLIGAAGLAFDAGRGYLINARLSQAVDAAALAGGRSLSIGGGGDYETPIKKYFKANFPDGYMGSVADDPNIKVSSDGSEIEVVATATVPTTLMRLLQVDDMKISARAVVNRTVKGLEIVMILDNSGSMKGGKMNDLKDAAQSLLDILYGGNTTVDDLYVSVVPFTGRTNVRGQDSVHPGKSPNKDFICFDLRPGVFQENDAPPSTHAFEHYSGPHSHGKNPTNYKNKVCPKASVLPLTQPKQDVEGAIKDMQAKGCTRYDVGSAWGWRAVSPDWQGLWIGAPSELPLDYDEPQMEKAVIIMTDGENTPACLDDDQTQEESEQVFANTCAKMKNNGIVVYTISFQLDDDGTNALFRSCASGDERYFKSPSGEELQEAFTTIANDLSTLRLSQ